MQPIFKKITSKFFQHYQTLLFEKRMQDVQLQFEQREKVEYGEKERRINYNKIGSNVEIIENVTIIENNIDNTSVKLEKDMKKMYF